MKKTIAAVGLAVSMSFVAAPAQAGGLFDFFSFKSHNKYTQTSGHHKGSGYKGGKHKSQGIHQFKRKEKCKPKSAVPEIDVAGAGIALALLGGVVSISRERRKQS